MTKQLQVCNFSFDLANHVQVFDGLAVKNFDRNLRTRKDVLAIWKKKKNEAESFKMLAHGARDYKYLGLNKTTPPFPHVQQFLWKWISS